MWQPADASLEVQLPERHDEPSQAVAEVRRAATSTGLANSTLSNRRLTVFTPSFDAGGRRVARPEEGCRACPRAEAART